MDAPAVDPVLLAHAKLAVASLCGGIVRLLVRPGQTFLHSMWMLFGCVTCGFYGTPIVMHWLALGEDYVGGIGAAIGFIGLTLAEAFLKAVEGFDLKAWLLTVLRSWLTRSNTPAPPED